MARTPKIRGGAKPAPGPAEPAVQSEPSAEDGVTAPAEFAASEALIPEPTGEISEVAPHLDAVEASEQSATAPDERTVESSLPSPSELHASVGKRELRDDAENTGTFDSQANLGSSDEVPVSLDVSASSVSEHSESAISEGLLHSRPSEDSRPIENTPDAMESAPEGFATPGMLMPGEVGSVAEFDGNKAASDRKDRELTENPSELTPTGDFFRFSDGATPHPAEVEERPVSTSGETLGEAGQSGAAVEAVGATGVLPAAVLPDRAASDATTKAKGGSLRNGRSVGGLFAAGLLGGVAALLLAALVQSFGFFSNSGVGTISGGIGDLQGEIDGLKSELASLKQAGAATNGDGPALASQLEAVRNDVAQLKAATPAAPELETRLAATEAKLTGLEGALNPEQLSGLADQVSAAQSLARDNSSAIQAQDGAFKQATERVGALEANFSGAQKELSQLQAEVAELRKGVESVQAQPRVALALAASALKDSAERGMPFTAELATLGTLAPSAPEIAQLQPYAESGVPTRAALAAEWNGKVDAILASADPKNENSGIFGQLLSGAGSLVSVRPIGAVEGTSVSAVVGRVQAALDAGDLEKALVEYGGLPEPAKQAGADLAAKIQARLAVERLVNEAIVNATKAA